MKRWAALAGVLVVVVVGLVVALTRAGNSAAQPSSLRGVVAQVRKDFGDKRLVRAQIDGSALHVVVARTDAGGGAKSAFEAMVLGAAVADWMRSRGQKPIEVVHYSNRRLNLFARSEQSAPAVPSTPAGPSVGLDTCKSATSRAQRSVWPSVTHTSIKWLPYLRGICVFRLRISSGYAVALVPQAALDTYLNLASTIFGTSPTVMPAYRAFFEVDDAHGQPLVEIRPLPGWCSEPWVRPDIPSPFEPGIVHPGVGQCRTA